MHFCRTDSVFSIIHHQLVNNPDVDGNKWAAEYANPKDARLNGLRFPVDPNQRLSLMYQLLAVGEEDPERIVGRLPFWYQLTTNSVSAYIHAFAEGVLSPLFRELGYRLDEIEENLPQQKTDTVSVNSLQIIHIKTESIVMQENEFTNSKNIQIGNQNVQDNRELNLKLTLEELIEQIDSANASPKVKQEAKNRFNKLLEHPLVSAIVGGATSALLTPR